MKEIPSIQTQLTKWLILPLSMFALILFIFLNNFIKDKVNEFFDNRLYASAKSIEDYIGVEDEKLIIDFPNFSVDSLSLTQKGLIYYSVVNESGKTLIGQKNLFDKDILISEDKRFYNKTYDGEKLRAISYKSFYIDSNKSYLAYITIAESMHERNENIKEVINTALMIILIVSIFIIIITLIAVNKGLEPLKLLKSRIKQRDSRDLTPLIFNAPQEIEDVVNSINILLERSRNNIEYIEQFNSDVSHQLRTPLAEMKMELEQFFTKKDEKFIILNSHINNMSHITEQLLLYAKTNPNTINLAR